MRRKLPPMTAVIAFEAAARHLSFTRAAQELGVAQPAVTRHVANLEAWVDTPLFTRKGNVVHLTPAGVALADLATANLDRFELGLRALPRPRGDQIVLGASFGIMHMWVMPRLAAMRAATSATVNFLTADNYDQYDDPSVDASIRFGTGAFPGFEAELLFGEECYVVASPRFLADHPDLDPDDLPGSLRPEWLLEHGDVHGIGWMTWRLWRDRVGARFPADVGLREIRNYPAILDMVRHAEGIAIGSVGLEDAHVLSGELVRLGPPQSRPRHGYYLVYRPEARARTGFDALRTLLSGAGRIAPRLPSSAGPL